MKRTLALWVLGFCTLLVGALAAVQRPAEAAFVPGTAIQDNFNADSGLWDYVGAATRNGSSGTLVLTPPYEGQAGLIWLKQTMSPPFAVSFRFRMSLHKYYEGSYVPADGITFMFNKQKTDYSEAASSQGFPIGTGYGVEFDTYYNHDDGQNWDQTPSNHISLFHNNANSDVPGELLQQAPYSQISNEQWHDARIIVLPDLVQVYVDGKLFIEKAMTFDPTYSQIGFSGSTGWYYSQQEIDDVSIRPVIRATQVATTAVERTYTAGETIPITIDFEQPVSINPVTAPTLLMNTGHTADFVSQPASTRATYQYIVQPGDQVERLQYASSAGLADSNVQYQLPSLQSPYSLGGSKRIAADGSLKLYMKFDGTYLEELSQTQATASGSPSFVTGPKGKAVQLYGYAPDGSPAPGAGKILFNASAQTNFGNAFTASFFAKVDSMAGVNGFGIFQPTDGSVVLWAKDTDKRGMALMKPSGINHLMFYEGGNYFTLPIELPSGTTLSDYLQQWHHYALTVGSSGVQLYIDGSLRSQQPYVMNPGSANDLPLSLGSLSDGWYPSNVSLDDFRMYGADLNATQIAALSGQQYKATQVTADVPANTTLYAQDSVTLSVYFNTPVTVVPGELVPVLKLNNGGTAVYDAGLSTPNQLKFVYKVNEDQAASVLNYISVLALDPRDAHIYANGTVIPVDLTLPHPESPESLGGQNLQVIPIGSNAKLSSLDVQGFSLDFDPNVTEYEITIPYEAGVPRIQYSPMVGTSQVVVIGSYTVQGTNQILPTLTTGTNVLQWRVTALNGSERTYTLTIHRSPPLYANLEYFYVAGTLMSPEFSSYEHTYSLYLPPATTQFPAFVVLSDPTASFTISGAAYTVVESTYGATQGVILNLANTNGFQITIANQSGQPTAVYQFSVQPMVTSANAVGYARMLDPSTIQVRFREGFEIDTEELEGRFQLSGVSVQVEGISSVRSNNGSVEVELNLTQPLGPYSSFYLHVLPGAIRNTATQQPAAQFQIPVYNLSSLAALSATIDTLQDGVHIDDVLRFTRSSTVASDINQDGVFDRQDLLFFLSLITNPVLMGTPPV